MKKLVSILVVLAMVLAMVPAAFAAEAATSGTIEALKSKEYTLDTWTADEAGVLTITLSAAEGVGYQVYKNGEALTLGFERTYDCALEYAVEAGDSYYVVVKGWNPDSWTFCDATINWAYSFSAGGTVKDAYAIAMDGEEYFAVSTTGDSQIPMIATAEVTVVTISPLETGIYTITVGDGAAIANCGSTSALINTDVEFGDQVVWTCEQAGRTESIEIPDEDYQETGDMITIEQYVPGQSLMLGIISDSETVTVNVAKTGEYVAPTTTNVVYENKAALSQFAVPADATVGSYVDVYGDTHTAVLGDDGYYHLDSADGDVLLVDMNYIATLSDVLKSDRPVMYAYVTDDAGNTTRYDIADAVLAYEAVCDENGYYPLTEDLIFFYDTYAAGCGIYQFYLSEGYNPDCAWMFACLTMSLPQQDVAPEGSGTEEDPYIISELPYTIEVSYKNEMQADAGIYYLYTPEKNGIISIQDFYDETNMGFLTEPESWTHVTESNRLEVTAGTPVLLYHWAFWPGEYDLTLLFTETTGEGGGEGGNQPGEGGGEEGGEGGDQPGEGGGEPVNPDDYAFSESDTVFVPVGEPIVVEFTTAVEGVLTVEIATEDGWEMFIRDDLGDTDNAYWSALGATSPVVENLPGGATYTVTICGTKIDDDWTYVDTTITYNITFVPTGTGSDVEVDGELVDGDNPMELPVEVDSVSYAYTATQTGKLYFTVTYVGLDTRGTGDYDNDYDDITNDFSIQTELTVDGNNLPYLYFGSIDVVEGETYVFTWTNVNEYFDWGWEATLNLSYTDELQPKVGTEELPVELHFEDCPTDSIEIPAGERAHYTLVGFTGANFTIKGVGAYAVVVTTEWDMTTGEVKLVETTYKAENGVVTVPVNSHYFNVQIGNNATAAKSFKLGAEYPVGSEQNPDELKLGTNTAAVAEGSEGYIFTWVAERDGVLTITVAGQYWNYSVANYGADMENYEGDVYGDWHLWADEPAVASEEWEVKAGDIIVVTVATFNPQDYTYPADTITVTASFEAATSEDVLYGDVNGDGEIDILDANLVVAWYNEIRELEDDQLAAADVNGDGDVDIMDANMIVAYYNELIDSFPVEK